MNKKIGIVVLTSICVGGGTARVVVDLISALNSLGKKVYLMTPFTVDFKKTKELYGKIKIEKIYKPGDLKKVFCKESILTRKLMKKEFQEMAKEVDMIIDIDGGILDKYIPEEFDKSKYILWRISCTKIQETPWTKKSWKKKVKFLIRDILKINQNENQNPLSKEHKIYAVDKWTAKELKENWGLNPEKLYLYPAIQINEFLYKGEKKENQIIISGRIAPNKMIEDSIRIFALGTKKFPEYRLIILGGATCDSKGYINYLKGIAEDLGILSRVEIIENPSFKKLKEILKKSKILLEAEREISITMTSIESMAAGNIVFAYKNGGTFDEVLENGKYGYGFESVKEGAKELDMILRKLKNKTLGPKNFIKKINFFSKENFIKRVKEIVDGKNRK